MLKFWPALRVIACLRRIAIALEEANTLTKEQVASQGRAKSPKLAEVFVAKGQDNEENYEARTSYPY